MEREVSDFKDNRFTREDLRGFASEMLGFFKREGIESKRSLDGKLGTFDSEIYPGGRIKVESPSNRVYVISYTIPVRGTPIKVNIDLGHYSVTVQCCEEIGEDYINLGGNTVGNLIQKRMLRYSWIYVRGSLRELMV